MKVLFVCVHNAGRSQMAEAFFNALAPEGFYAISAGTEPADLVNPTVVAVMAEAGIDLTGKKPAPLKEELVSGSDVAITMGCGVQETCPLYLGVRIDEDWGLDDPAGQPMEIARRIRDQVRDRVLLLIERLKNKKHNSGPGDGG